MIIKKILLSLGLLSLGAYAQSFPDPYCDVTEFEAIEMITQVELNGVTITNTNDDDPLVDYTETVVDLQKGNTEGDYTNKFIMYIDWNQNGILNDSG